MKTRFCLAAFVLLTMMTISATFAASSLQSQITAQLNHPDAWVQARAAYLLGEFGYQTAVPVLTRTLNDSACQQIVRIHAAIALGRLGNTMGKSFCADIQAKRGWRNNVMAQTAQAEFMTMIAQRVANGTDKPTAVKSGTTLTKAVDGLTNATAPLVDCGQVTIAGEKLVLLDRHDTEMWVLLADSFYNQKTRKAAILAVAKALNPKANDIAMEIRRASTS